MSDYICAHCGRHCGPTEAGMYAHLLEGCVRPWPFLLPEHPDMILEAHAIVARN